MSADAIAASINQLGKLEVSKNKHTETLQFNRNEFFKKKLPPGVALMLMVFYLFQSGPSLASDKSTKGSLKDPSGSTFVESYEDKLRETGVQKGVANAFSSGLTAAQNAFNDTIAVSTDTIRQRLFELRDGLDNLQALVPTGSPFDPATVESIQQSIDTLIGNRTDFPHGGGGILKEIENLGGLKALYDKAKTAGDTSGAANIIKRVSDQFSSVGTSTQTVSSMVTTKTNLNAADLQTMQAFLNSFIRALADGIKSFNKAPQ